MCKCASNRLLKKSGLNTETLKKHRAVSNLPIVSKILEKVVDARIEHHVVLNCLHELLQSAYRKFHSTDTGLLMVNNDIFESGSGYSFSACHARPIRIIWHHWPRNTTTIFEATPWHQFGWHGIWVIVSSWLVLIVNCLTSIDDSRLRCIRTCWS